VVNRRNHAPNLVRVAYAIHAGEDLYRFVTTATNTWFKTGFYTKVNLSFGLKPDLAFRLSFVLKP